MKWSKNRYTVCHFDKLRILSFGERAEIVEETRHAYLQGIKKAANFLKLGSEMPFATVYLCPSRSEYDLFVAHLTSTPTKKSRVGQPQGAELYLLTPSAYPIDAESFFLGSDGQYKKEKYHRLVVHECVHMVEEAVRPRGAMETIPLWWSEGLAVYLSEQFREEDIREHMSADSHLFESMGLDSLTGEKAYTWGWTVVRFVEGAFGSEAIAQFSREEGEVELHRFLGISKAQFEEKWRNHAHRAVYELPNPDLGP